MNLKIFLKNKDIVSVIITDMDNSLPLQKIVATKDSKRLLINIKNIIYFFAYSNEIKVVTDDNSIYTVQHPLHFWEERLANRSFLRCHKGYLVNLEKIVEIIPSYNSTLDLKLSMHKKTVPVGRNYIKKFKETVCW